MPASVRREIENDPKNFQPLPQKLNGSKNNCSETCGSGSKEPWQGYDAPISEEWRENVRKHEERMIIKIEGTLEEHDITP